MSDACGTDGLKGPVSWTFDDDASAALPEDDSCNGLQARTFKPSNYKGGVPEPDQFGAGGGIVPPYGDALSAFDGTDPNGFWDLYAQDDNPGVVGMQAEGWMLRIETGATAGPPTPTGNAKRTGRRARALKRCKNRKTKRARARCRAHAMTLPR